MQAHPLVSHLMQMTPKELGQTVFLWADGSMTFGQLRERMLRMAAWLVRSAGVGAGYRFAICLPKSPEAAIALYGIMASGGVYVPLQFQGPPDRLNAILKSVQPCLLLTTSTMADLLGTSDVGMVQSVDLEADGSGLEPLMHDVTGLAGPLDA